MKAPNTYINQFVLAAALAASSSMASAQSSPMAAGSRTRDYYPGNMIGRLEYNYGHGTATAIKPYSVLTCGHVIYRQGTGWTSNIAFKRGYYEGSQLNPTNSCTARWVLTGYNPTVDQKGASSREAFDRDIGGVLLRSPAANGGWAGSWQNPAQLTSPVYTMIYGYGVNASLKHNGSQLLFNTNYKTGYPHPFQKSYGMYFRNSLMGSEGGMSGGPVFTVYKGAWWISAVVVSGIKEDLKIGFKGDPSRWAGVRALDAGSTSIINNLLR